jgi:hypothetical protein
MAASAFLASLFAGYLFYRSRDEGRALVVEEPEVILNDVTLGREYDLGYRLCNRTSRTLRVVGTEFG